MIFFNSLAANDEETFQVKARLSEKLQEMLHLFFVPALVTR